MSKFIRLATLAALLPAALGCAGGSEPKPRWVEAAGANVPAYTTFGWSDRSGQPPVTILDNQIRDAIRAALTGKGYLETSDSPDFLVSHETFEQATVKQGNPVRIGIGMGSWGGNVGGSVGTSVDVGDKEKVLQQMSITIRALDGEEGTEAWIGTTAPVAEHPDQATVTQAVNGVMKGFPARAD